MEQRKDIMHGDFTSLAQTYSEYRVGYSKSVLKALIALLNKPVEQCDFVDIGAGTGIWTRMLADTRPASIIAVEPNDDMRQVGIRDSKSMGIEWLKGSGEATGLASESVDMLSMASSFHWVDFEKGCKEFHRVLKRDGRFVALWNPRLIEANFFLKELEDYIFFLNPDVKRVSSGRSSLVENLTDKLYQTKLFSDVVYIEGRNTITITPQQYVGAWRSVNDVRFQLGTEKFEEFIAYVESRLLNYSSVQVTYLTRAWSASKI